MSRSKQNKKAACRRAGGMGCMKVTSIHTSLF
nr:MAG TPA: hypothetical protein [Caudoviricetes sp.]